MKDYGKKYWNTKQSFMSLTTHQDELEQQSEKMRIVNQDEIVNYFKHHPGKTETQMQRKLYDYDRSTSMISNKKYADCLRRALYNGKISRVRAQTKKGKRYIYYAV